MQTNKRKKGDTENLDFYVINRFTNESSVSTKRLYKNKKKSNGQKLPVPCILFPINQACPPPRVQQFTRRRKYIHGGMAERDAFLPRGAAPLYLEKKGGEGAEEANCV